MGSMENNIKSYNTDYLWKEIGQKIGSGHDLTGNLVIVISSTCMLLRSQTV
jgi:hypothetical protein